MSDFGRRLLRAAGSAAWCVAVLVAQPAWAAVTPEFLATRPSDEARRLVEWASSTKDTRGRPYAVVDKKKAHFYVFHADGRLAGHTTALLGSAIGDHSAPLVGQNTQNGHVPPEERTTPAGRFDAVPGENSSGEHVVWVDYDAAFAIHRLRPGLSYGPRVSRLAATSASAKRVSWGCVVVPVPFYQKVVQPVLGRSRSVVYVMPETMPLGRVIESL